MSGTPFLGAAVAFLLWPGSLFAQDPGFTVEGRVVEKNATAGIPDVTLELEGASTATARTAGDGRFRFEGVEPGGYTIRILPYGYRPRAQYVFVDEDVALILPLAVAPIRDRWNRKTGARWIDPGAGGSGSGVVDVEGVVREGEWGLPLSEVDVLTDLGRSTRTVARGSFMLAGVPGDRSLLVSVRAFGYLPVDTVFVPGEATRFDIRLTPDPAVQRRIDREEELLKRRSARHRGATWDLGREALLASSASTAAGTIRTHYGELASRIRCVVVDDGLGGGTAELSKLAPGQLQRIELLTHPRSPEAVVARVYTRAFIRDLVAGGVEARSGEFEYVHEAGCGPEHSADSADGFICSAASEAEP